MAETNSDGRSFTQLVVIGSSAGGIEALSALVATLPPDCPAPIVLAQHLDPNRPSQLTSILTQRSTLPVRTIADGPPSVLAPGVVFVVPANRHVQIDDHTIALQDAAGRPKPSVDLLLSSAAEMYGEELIAVILTGNGSDGAIGAYNVKKAGGTVVIQNPDTASFPSMPQSLAPNTVDIVADLDRIGPIVGDLLRGLAVPARPDEAPELDAFLLRVRDRLGVDFSTYKLPTIRRRLQRRIVATATGNLAGYNRFLDEHPEEYQQILRTFLIKVTEFFRDPELFDQLRDTVLPELIDAARRRGNELRIWSAGCATGEEAYSLAILAAEALGDRLDDFNARIFATDLDEEAIAFARRGIYSAAALADLPDELIARYFTIEGGNYQVRKELRALTVFGQHDLARRAPFPRIDLILCRNVLIYFTPELQRRALQLFAYSLRDGGYLMLGKSETTRPRAEFFAPQESRHKLYRRQGERITMSPAGETNRFPARPFPPRFAPVGRGAGAAPDRARRSATPSFGEGAALQLPVGIVTVDRRYDILTINSAARRFLAIHSPALGEDLVHLAQGVPPTQLRAAIDAAFRGVDPVTIDEIAFEELTTGERRFLQIGCTPQRGEGVRGPVEAVVVVVTDVTPAVAARREVERQLEAAGAERRVAEEEAAAAAARRDALVDRLVETNRQLMEANQELTATNEELRAVNEERLLGTEEAQAAAEEVETLNEEMQATNEELETLNEELQATVEELHTTNDELQARSLELLELANISEEERARLEAVLASMGEAVLAIDRQGRPVLTNAAYQRMFGDTATNSPVALDETGRALGEASPWRRAARGESFGTKFILLEADGARRRFEATGRPVADGDGGHRLGVLVLRDITARAVADEALREREMRLRLFTEQLPAILWATDAELRFTLSVGAGLAGLGLRPEEVVGRTLADFFGTTDPDAPPLAEHRRALAGESVRYELDIAGRTFENYVEPVRAPDGTIAGTIGVAHDVTDRSLRRLQDEFLALASHELRTPLTPLQSYLQLLLRRLGDGPEAERPRHYAEIALAQVRRLARLVDDLTDTARLRNGRLSLQLAPVRLDEVVARSVEAAQTLAVGQAIQLAPDAAPLTVRGDADRLHQVMLNLLSNAITYALGTERIDVRLRRAGDRAEVQVQDYGPGVPAAALPNLFERFYQVVGSPQASPPTPRTGGGLGLGLYIVREIVTAHGGTIEVVSAEGEGTTFTVRLPLA